MIYVIRNNRAVKIGYSKDPGRRLEEHQVSNYEVLTLEYVVRADNFTVRDYERLERVIQKIAEEEAANGRARKGSEWFYLSDRQVRRVLYKVKKDYGFYVATAKVYSEACIKYEDRFDSTQLYSTRNKALNARVGIKLTQQDELTKSVVKAFLDLLETSSYRISYAAIGNAANQDQEDVRDVMRREGFTKILIEHNEKA